MMTITRVLLQKWGGDIIMTIQQIRYVIAIAETGSINRAAEVLYVAQPSLTSALREVEKELDITIFNRSGRGVTITPEGADFLLYAKQLYSDYGNMMERFGNAAQRKKKFGVSAQHYSFAVKAFVDLVKEYDTSKYEFAIRETQIEEVLLDVANYRSELGILNISDLNKKAIDKNLKNLGLSFNHLITCDPHIYLWKGHPLSYKEALIFEELVDYPCLIFEQGYKSSLYYTEEVLRNKEIERTIFASDRATMLNLMVGLNAYMVSSGIVCEELNGDNYVAIPLNPSPEFTSCEIEIGYVIKKKSSISKIGQLYINNIKEYLNAYK